MFITAKKQSRHLNSAVRADLVHPSCKAGNRSSSNPSLPEHSYQCSWWPRIMPRRLSPQWYRTALMLQGEDSLAVFLLAFLFQQKTWLTWWETPLALVAIPALFQGCQCPAVEQHSVQSNASSKLFPSCPNDVLRTYKGYNVRIILHFFFFFFYRRKLHSCPVLDLVCPARLTIFIKGIKMCLLKDTGDQLLPQQVTHLGIHNDAIGIQLFHFTFN